MKLFEVLIMIIILVSTILIGTPIKYNCVGFSLAIVLIGIIFIIYMLCKKKKIIENKLDIVVLILCLSPIIPLVFGSYISLNDTLEYLLKYLSCFSIYIMVKQVLKSNPNALKRIINVLIISSLILIVIGIDFMTTQILVQPLEKLGIPYMENLGKVMASSIGTTNSFAIILAISTMLILYQISKEKKAIYFPALVLNFATLLLTNSRAVWLIFAVFFIAYLILQKDKKKSMYILYTMVLTGIMSIIYLLLWNKIRTQKQYILLWITIVIISVISYFIYKLFNKFYDKISRISKKKIIIATVIFAVGIIALFIIGTKLTKPLTIFLEGSNNGTVKYEIKDIKPNADYSFKFNINAKSKINEMENYSIAVVEENKYYDEVKSHYITFNNYSGVKQINIKTQQETIRITVIFGSNEKEAQDGLTINEFTLNNEPYPLSYMYLPNRLVENIKNIDFRDKSVWERGTFYKDAFEIIKMDPLTGQGANSWHYLYQDVQSYRYEATEVHSYPIQILMDYGIVPLIAFIAIIVIILTKNRSFYTFVFLLLIAHSIIDFDMSFFYIMILAFILLAIISSKHEDKQEEIKAVDKIISIVLILVLLFWSGFEIIYLNRPKLDITQALELVDNNRGNELINYIKNEQKLEKYLFNSYYLEDLNYSNVSYENLQYMYDNIANQKLTLDIDANMKRNKLISKIIITTTNEEMKNKFIDIILNENEKNIELIKNKEKNRLTDNMISIFLSIQDSTYKSIQKLKE